MNECKQYSELALANFADLFGTTTDDFSDACKSLIEQSDFRYQRISSEEWDYILLDILKKLDSDELPASGKDRRVDWEKGWSENLESFIQSDYNLSELIPKYFRPDRLVRLKCEYVKPCDDGFELNFIKVLRAWLATKYLTDVDSVYEFGCGTGYHLVSLSKLFPDKRIHGLDWVDVSQTIVNFIAERYGLHIEAHSFDFYQPDERLEFGNNSAILTFAALEQIGSNYEAFLQFLLKKSPALCINVECFCELYDENNLIDYLAIKYHKKRHYLDGYLTRLQQLEGDGKIEIFETKRPYFGCMYHEAYSFVIWKPKI